mgnify:CR=1 FL=1
MIIISRPCDDYPHILEENEILGKINKISNPRANWLGLQGAG